MNTTHKTKGFTIIEVVLVLAIAGLIFLMVFLALPALQRNQRDTQRRSDLGRLISAVQTYQSNNSGKLPWTWVGTTTQTVAAGDTTTTLANLVPKYIDTFNDPGTVSPYQTVAGTPANVGELQIVKDKDCAGATSVGKIAFTVKVENGTTLCQTN
jgi:prepilin-type N-terminal cleavage/methylation domain-containing protein